VKQGQIDADWLTADWHEKGRPKWRRRRNVLPDAYRALSKKEKRLVRAAAKWIFKRVALLDWGRKMPDEKAGKPVPKPVNLKDQVLPYVQGTWGTWIRKLTLTAIIRHLVSDDTTRMTAHELRTLPERFPVAEPVKREPEEKPPAPEVVKGSVSGNLVDPEVVRRLEPLAKELLCLHATVVGRSSRAKIVAEDVQAALAVIRACTLRPNPDGSMPVMRVKAIWDAVHAAGDTTRAFSFHRFQAIRNMLSDMGLLEWEDSTYQFGKACRWRASEKLMERMESVLSGSSTTTTLSLSSIVVCNLVAEAQQERPDQVGLRPKMVSPSELRTDWDGKLREAGLEHLSRMAA
jgi:hypothetical protein